LDNLPEGSAFIRSVVGPDSQWSLEAHLLALISDQLAVANWQRTGKKDDYPKPLPRPGLVSDATAFGTAIPLDDLKAFFARRDKEATE
jgi:hypothetical protein